MKVYFKCFKDVVKGKMISSDFGLFLTQRNCLTSEEMKHIEVV